MTNGRVTMWLVYKKLRGKRVRADLLIVLLVGSHGSQLLFFHDLHEALLQTLAHQHLQQWLYLYQRNTCVTAVINAMLTWQPVCVYCWTFNANTTSNADEYGQYGALTK